MTTSDYRKAFTQLKAKPAKLKKYIRFNAPKKRSTGTNLKKCRLCGRVRGHISKYGLHICRQCFRECALDLGFNKFS